MKNQYLLPLINEILDCLSDARVFTKVDVKNAYYRLWIREGDEWKTAFQIRYGLLEYLVMPFGLTNTSTSFQSYIHGVLRLYLDITVIVYLDYVLLFLAILLCTRNTFEKYLKPFSRPGCMQNWANAYSVSPASLFSALSSQIKVFKWKMIAFLQCETGQSHNPSVKSNVFLHWPTSITDLSKGFPK